MVHVEYYSIIQIQVTVAPQRHVEFQYKVIAWSSSSERIAGSLRYIMCIYYCINFVVSRGLHLNMIRIYKMDSSAFISEDWRVLFKRAKETEIKRKILILFQGHPILGEFAGAYIYNY